jgi:hypothetical protein
MNGLDILVGVAPQSPQVNFLCALLGDADHAPDGRKRMMAQPQRNDLLFAPGDLLPDLRGLGVAAATLFRFSRQLV